MDVLEAMKRICLGEELRTTLEYLHISRPKLIAIKSPLDTFL